MHRYALIHILSNKRPFAMVSSVDPIAAAAVFYKYGKLLSFGLAVGFNSLEILTSLPVDIVHRERPSECL